MDGKTLAQIGVLTALVAAAGFFVFRNAKELGEGDDFTTRKMQYMCGDPACSEGFVVTMKEIRAASSAGHGVKCPKCGKEISIAAFKCPSCGKMNRPEGHGQVPKNCAFCKKPIPPESVDPNK